MQLGEKGMREQANAGRVRPLGRVTCDPLMVKESLL
jgi:hypothetical protein